MNILITGATGRVGSKLAEVLIDRGDHVRTLALPDDPNLDQARQTGIDCIVGDLTNLTDVRRAAEEVDAIFHLAALILFQSQARQLLWDVNVVGTYNLFEAAVQQARRPLRLIFASSDQVYPSRFAGYRPTDENHPRQPYTFYGLTKLLGEDMLHFYAKSEKDVTNTIARFSHTEAAEELIDPHGVFSGPTFYVNGRLKNLKESGSSHPNTLTLIKLLEPLASPDEPLLLTYDQNGEPHYQELVDVRDIVQGLLLMLDRPEAIGESFNLTPPTIASLTEFIPYMAEATGRRYVEVQIPFETGKCYGSSAKARALLGYQPKYTLFDMIDEAVGRLRKSEEERFEPRQD